MVRLAPTSAPYFPPRRVLIFCALLSYLFTLMIRLPNIYTDPLQTDESHWIGRSSRVLSRLESDPLDATTHLGHPGVLPSLVVAAGQASYNLVRPPATEAERFTPARMLKPSRLAITLFAALVSPLFVVALSPILGTAGATLGALWLALDPQLFGFSRIVHLDATLTMMVLLTVSLYGWGKLKDKRHLALLSGVTWGLAVLCKPTCIVLIPTFLLWNFLCWMRNRAHLIVSSAELWAIALGHLVIALFWTRLWHHGGELTVRLGVRSYAAALTYDIGASLQHGWILALGLIGYGMWKSRLIQHAEVRSILRLILTALAIWLVFPQIPENLIRFWLWVGGLSHEIHKSFNHVYPPMAGGYLGFAWAFLPPLTTAAFVIGGGRIFIQRSRAVQSSDQFLLLAFLVTILWCLPLSFSDKQSWRYALPMVPLVYLIALYGLLPGTRHHPKYRGWAIALGIFIIVFQSWSLSGAYRDAESYVNPLYHNIGKLLAEGRIRPLHGQREAVEAIAAHRPTDDRSFVAVLGEASTLRLAADYALGHGARQINFGWAIPQSSHYMIAQSGLRPYPAPWNLFEDAQPLYRATYHGFETLAVYTVPPPRYDVPLKLEVKGMRGTTGVVVQLRNSGEKVLRANPKNHPQGFLMVRQPLLRAPVPPRPITLSVTLSGTPEASPEPLVGNLRLSSHCQREISKTELSQSRKTISLTCPATHEGPLGPALYWYGKHPLTLYGVSVAGEDPLP